MNLTATSTKDLLLQFIAVRQRKADIEREFNKVNLTEKSITVELDSRAVAFDGKNVDKSITWTFIDEAEHIRSVTLTRAGGSPWLYFPGQMDPDDFDTKRLKTNGGAASVLDVAALATESDTHHQAVS